MPARISVVLSRLFSFSLCTIVVHCSFEAPAHHCQHAALRALDCIRGNACAPTFRPLQHIDGVPPCVVCLPFCVKIFHFINDCTNYPYQDTIVGSLLGEVAFELYSMCAVIAEHIAPAFNAHTRGPPMCPEKHRSLPRSSPVCYNRSAVGTALSFVPPLKHHVVTCVPPLLLGRPDGASHATAVGLGLPCAAPLSRSSER